MSNTNPTHKGNPLYSARLLGIGAVIIGTLASCSNNGNPASTANNPQSTIGVTLAPQPSATAVPATAAKSNAQPTDASQTAEPTTAAPAPATTIPASTGHFKDGEYTSDPTRVDRWGNLQVRAIIQGGQLVKVDIVEFPHSTRRSDLISHAALPTLITEAIKNQDANVDAVSRATDTSVAFVAALESALSSAASGNA